LVVADDVALLLLSLELNLAIFDLMSYVSLGICRIPAHVTLFFHSTRWSI